MKKSKRNLLIVIGVILILWYIGSNSNSANSNNTNSASNSEVFNSTWDGSVYQVEQFLKTSYLKDPDSYESIGWSKVIKAPAGSDFSYSVRNEYRAKNGFGGYVVKNQIFYLDAQGNVLRVKDIN